MSECLRTAMQPALPCSFDNEDFVDFEAAQQYSIPSEDWTLSELDEAALGIEHKTTGGGTGKAKKASPRGVMKASMLDVPEDDLYNGAARSYSPSFNKARPTMISAKYRLKEERRKVLKISINKLKKIEDPESSLRRSVLINNTMKRLQKEAREERREKQQLPASFPRYSPSYKSFVLREDSVKGEEHPSEAPARLKPEANKENASPFPPAERKSAKTPLDCLCEETIEELVDVTTLDEELSRPLEELANPVNLLEPRKRPFEDDMVQPLEALSSLLDNGKATSRSGDSRENEERPGGKRRCYEEVEDSEIHDVLSQFYIPPTPRMLTSIDDEEEVNVVDIDMEPSESKHPIVVPKVPDFESLVSEDLDEPVSLSDRAVFESQSTDDAVFCKYQSAKDASSSSPTSSFETVSSYGYLSAGETRSCETESSIVRTVCEVGSVNCGTVNVRRLSADTDHTGNCTRVEENLSAAAKHADRRSPINRLTEVMSWTTKCLDSQYNSSASLGKTLTDCCYSNPETNNNNTEQKYSCAHAAIFTELQSQVYHNFVTSLES